MNTLKKTLAVLLCAAMTVPAFACGEKIDPANDDSSSVSDSDGANAENSSEGGDAEGGADASSNDDSSEGANQAVIEDEANIVTDADGVQNHKITFEQMAEETPVVTSRKAADGTVYIGKTDINGAAVTEAGGEAVTEVYTGVTNAAEYPDDYEPSIKTYQAFWMDISERKDFVFDGDLLEFEVKIADDTPDGVYPVEIYYTDFSNYSANQDENGSVMKNVAYRPGYICVNADEPAEEALGTAMTLTPETLSAKPGDTVRLRVRIDNNPGIVAFIVRMHYDENMMTILEAGAGADLGELATLTTNTLDN